MNSNNSETVEFKRKMANVKYALKHLKQKGVFITPLASRLLVRTWTIKTMGELDQLTSELAEICQRK